MEPTKLEGEMKSPNSERIWGIILIIAAFIIVMLLAIQLQLFSLVFKYHYAATNISTTRITWIFNIFQFTWDFSSLFSGPLCDLFGYQKVAVASAFTYAMSTISTGLYSNANYLFLSCSVFTGIGGGILFAVCQYVLPLYFNKRLGLAVGIMNAGMSAGQFIGPIMVEYLQSLYGVYAVYIIGALELNTVVCAMFFLPPGWTKKRSAPLDTEQSKSGPINEYELSHINEGYGSTNDKPLKECGSVELTEAPRTLPIVSKIQKKSLGSQFKEVLIKVAQNAGLIRLPKVFIISFSMALLYVSQTNFMLLIPLALEERGNISENLITWCFSVAAITNLVARVVVPAVSDCLPMSKMWYVLSGSLLMCLSQIGFTLVENETALLSAMALFGISMSFSTALQPLIIIEFMGVDMLPATWGANASFMAILFLTIGPAIGLVRDVTQSYRFSIWFISGLAFMSAVLWATMPFVRTRERKNILAAKKHNTTSP